MCGKWGVCRIGVMCRNGVCVERGICVCEYGIYLRVLHRGERGGEDEGEVRSLIRETYPGEALVLFTGGGVPWCCKNLPQ